MNVGLTSPRELEAAAAISELLDEAIEAHEASGHARHRLQIEIVRHLLTDLARSGHGELLREFAGRVALSLAGPSDTHHC